MKNLKKLILCLCVCCFVTNAYAQVNDDKNAAAEKLVQILNFEKEMINLMKQKNQARSNKMSEQDFKRIFDEKFTNNMQLAVKESILNTYTLEEINAQNEFYQTSAGQSVLDKQYDFYQKIQNKSFEIMMPAILESMRQK